MSGSLITILGGAVSLIAVKIPARVNWSSPLGIGVTPPPRNGRLH